MLNTGAGISAFIGLGSNLAAPALHLRSALKEISLRLDDTVLTACSRLYRSKPMGPGDQPDYINAVAHIQTRLPPEQLLVQLQSLEYDHGRVRGLRWRERTLDLDVLIYGDQIIDTKELTVPHPGIATRGFVLIPLVEIAPNLTVPQRGAIRDMVQSIDPGELICIGDSAIDRWVAIRPSTDS